jgi:hypothetical protein
VVPDVLEPEPVDVGAAGAADVADLLSADFVSAAGLLSAGLSAFAASL